MYLQHNTPFSEQLKDFSDPKLCQCNSCKFIFTEHVPTSKEINEYYDEDYDPILNRKMKCEDPDLEIPKDHRINALDCASAGTRIRSAEEEAREEV